MSGSGGLRNLSERNGQCLRTIALMGHHASVREFDRLDMVRSCELQAPSGDTGGCGTYRP